MCLPKRGELAPFLLTPAQELGVRWWFASDLLLDSSKRTQETTLGSTAAWMRCETDGKSVLVGNADAGTKPAGQTRLGISRKATFGFFWNKAP